MDKIKGFDDWSAGASPEKLEEKKKKTTSLEGDALVKEAKAILDEVPANTEEKVAEQADRLETILSDVRRRKRKAKHRSDEKAELVDLIDKLKDKKKDFKKSTKIEKKLSTEKRIKWDDVNGKFKLIRKRDKDKNSDTFVFKSTDKHTKIFKADGHLTDEASAYLSEIFSNIDDFNVVETELRNAKYNRRKQSVEFTIEKKMVTPDELLLSSDIEDAAGAEEEPTNEPEVVAGPTEDPDAKKNEALDIIVAAREGRKRESFSGFDGWFLIEWANAIKSDVPFWISQDGSSHRTLTAKTLTGNEPEVIAYNKANAIAEPAVSSNTGYTINSYGGVKLNTEQIRKMQKWMYDNGGAPVKHAIEFSGGIDGKIGKGFDKSVKYLIKNKIISDVNDLLNKTMNTNQLKLEIEPYVAKADSTRVDTSRYDIPKYPTGLKY